LTIPLAELRAHGGFRADSGYADAKGTTGRKHSMSASRERYHHGDLRAALIEAGLDLLREVGPAALSLRAAARKAGVSAMAPYRHFADKDDLLAAVAAHGFRLFGGALAGSSAAQAGANDALRAQGVAYVRFATAEPALFRLMFGPVIGGEAGLEALKGAGAPAFDQLRAGVAAAMPGLEAQAREDFVLACWSIVHGLSCLLVDGKIPPLDDLDGAVERMLRLLLPPNA
jgi:AcrR family transcriptional regulator